jgi:hypothetical protein
MIAPGIKNAEVAMQAGNPAPSEGTLISGKAVALPV